MEKLKKQIEKKVSDLLQNTAFFLVEIKISKTLNKVEIILDGDQGIGFDKCSEINKIIGNYIEENNLIERSYNLVVGSPGIGKPLKLIRQYNNQIGRTLTIKLKSGAIKEGVLLEIVEQSKIIIKEKTNKNKSKKIQAKESEISFSEIEQARVEISFA